MAAGLALFPFFRQALFVDDHAHFEQAERIAWTGGGPYSKTAGGLGWVKGQIPGEANGPVYLMAVGGLIRLLGDEVSVVRLALFPLHLAGVFSVYFLARRFVRRPFLASLVWLVSPHVWLTTNSLLVDAMLASLVSIGICLWVEGWERDSDLLLAGGAFFQGLSFLVKYTGLISIAVSLIWILLWSKRRFHGKSLWLSIPVGMGVGWFLWSRSFYGESHFLAVARGSLSFHGGDRWVTLAAFATATTPILALAGIKNLLTNKPARVGALGAFLAAGILAPFTDMITTFGLCALASLFVVALWPAAPDADRAPGEGWLRSWILLGVVGLWAARGWVCARYLVVIGIPLVLLSLQVLESWRFWGKIGRSALWGLIVYGGCLAAANFQQAAVDPWAIKEVQKKFGRDTSVQWFFPAATLSGLPYYGAKAGWRPLKPGEDIPPGGRLLLPARRLPKVFWPNTQGAAVLGTFSAPRGLPFRLLGSKAGFYGSIWGPRPFGFSLEPAEKFYIFESTHK